MNLNFESPEWHGNVLKDREERLGKGEETPVDWEKAKDELRNRFIVARSPASVDNPN